MAMAKTPFRDHDPRVRRRPRRLRDARADDGQAVRRRHVAVLGAADLVHRRPRRRRLGGREGRQPAARRRRRAQAHLGDRRLATTARACGRAAIRACSSKAATAARRWELNRALFEHPTRPRWKPDSGGLSVHSIAPWPGEPDRLALAISAAGIWLTDDGGATWRHGNEGIVADYLPEQARGTAIDLCVHHIERAPARPERLFMQFHGGVYRSDDAGESWIDIAAGLPSDFGFPVARRPVRSRQRVRHPGRDRGPRHAWRQGARLGDARRRARAGRRTATGCPSATRTCRSCASPSIAPARATDSSCTSARRRARSSARATPASGGSAWRAGCRRSRRVRVGR